MFYSLSLDSLVFETHLNENSGNFTRGTKMGASYLHLQCT